MTLFELKIVMKEGVSAGALADAVNSNVTFRQFHQMLDSMDTRELQKFIQIKLPAKGEFKKLAKDELELRRDAGSSKQGVMKAYMSDISQADLLHPEDERKLGNVMQSGERDEDWIANYVEQEGGYGAGSMNDRIEDFEKSRYYKPGMTDEQFAKAMIRWMHKIATGEIEESVMTEAPLPDIFDIDMNDPSTLKAIRINKLFPEDYVVVKADGQLLTFANGEIVIYGDKEEAEYDAGSGETVVACVDLPPELQDKLLEQIDEKDEKGEL